MVLPGALEYECWKCSISYMGCYPSHWRTPSCLKMGTLHHQPDDIGWVILCFWGTTWFFNVREIFYLVVQCSKVGCGLGQGPKHAEAVESVFCTSGAVGAASLSVWNMMAGFPGSKPCSNWLPAEWVGGIDGYWGMEICNKCLFVFVWCPMQLDWGNLWLDPDPTATPALGRKGISMDLAEMLEIIWRFLASDLVPMATPKLWEYTKIVEI